MLTAFLPSSDDSAVAAADATATAFANGADAPHLPWPTLAVDCQVKEDNTHS